MGEGSRQGPSVKARGRQVGSLGLGRGGDDPCLGFLAQTGHCIHFRAVATTRPFSQKTKIMAASPITLWQIEGGKVETVTDFIFLGSNSDCSQDRKSVV